MINIVCNPRESITMTSRLWQLEISTVNMDNSVRVDDFLLPEFLNDDTPQPVANSTRLDNVLPPDADKPLAELKFIRGRKGGKQWWVCLQV